ncbi:MAG: XdhC family protein [Anaerolineae bacterium]|nr:XdhC family protein [Anaerolineae bacterium]
MYEELEAVYTAILEALRTGQPAAVATVVEADGSTPRDVGAKMLIRADGQTVGTVGGGDVEQRVTAAARVAIAEGRGREVAIQPPASPTADVCGAGMRVLIEVLPARPTLLVVGAGHVGQAVAEMGAALGYRIVVVDDRPELLAPARFPAAAERRAGDLAEQVGALAPDEHTYVVIVTPHHTRDEHVLAVLAERPVPYVGLMGSQRRTANTFRRAQEAGIPAAFLERIHTPVGLDIGAETPREIAVSILAQVIATQRGVNEQ